MPEENKKSLASRNVAVVAHQTTSFSGPLPPPEVLEGYNNILPGLADRIVKMAEGQSVHRQRLESRVIWFDGFRSTIGLISGLLIALGGIGAGTWIIISGNSVAGLVSLFAPLGTIVAAFIYQKRENPKQPRE